MNKSIRQAGLSRTADSYVKRLEQAQKLREIANRSNYPHKVLVLYKKIKEECEFWEQKQNPSPEKLEDLHRDFNFIAPQVNATPTDKDRIDMLMNKYGCK